MAQASQVWRSFVTPFLVSGGMALGAVLGATRVFDAALQEGLAGDQAGAAGALLVVLCMVTGLGLSTLTVVTAALLGREAPRRLGLRLLLSFVCGYVLGAMAERQDEWAMAWMLLLAWPVAGSWPWRRKAASAAGTEPTKGQ